MILQDTIEIIANQGNLRILRPIFGYDIEIGKIYFTPIEKLSKSSHYKIKVKCDFCDFTRDNMSYKEYVRNIEKDGKYYCSKCSPMKVENSKFEKYGDKHYGLEKGRSNILDLYGVENVFQLESIKKKSKETKFEKYGDENYTNLKKQKETIKTLYGVDNISQLEEIKKRKEKTCMINYGVSYPFQDKDIMKEYNEFIKEKYGVDHISHSEEIKNKKINTCLKRYGVKYALQNKDVIKKRIETLEKNRTYDLNDIKDYRYLVVKMTKRNKKELLEKWNGYDYYDNQYIADNFNLSPSDRQYPTIDHKLSIFFCFMNNISVEEASSIENLCMTKRTYNSSKNRKNEAVFIKQTQFISINK